MGSIRVLPGEVASQIAAGEVVERPASVVKELVENALDAGASRIDVRMAGGGADRIEVADNGSGMEREDALLSLERHATSKVRRISDLDSLATFGFRGEALPSIASVSRFTLTTGTGTGGGIQVRLDASGRIVASPAAHPRGTTVVVEALFHNAPARRKFLRAAGTEAAHVGDLLGRLAAAHPAIAFRLMSGEREQFHWPAAPDLRARAAQIVGPGDAAHLHEVDLREGACRVTGLASDAEISRASSRDEILYVNARPIRDRRLLHAVQQAYLSVLPRGRFPLLFLFLEIPAAEVDVNVHPAKSEVRFRHPGAIHDVVLRALRRTHESVRPLGPAAASGSHPRIGAFVLAEPEVDGWGSHVPLKDADRSATLGPQRALLPFDVTPLAQFRDTYILSSAPEGIVIVDQHAAHERILYERHLAAAETKSVERQRLLFPIVLEIAAHRMEAIESGQGILAELGFSLAAVGPASLRLDEVPAAIPAAAASRLLQDLLEELTVQDRPASAGDLRHRIAALSACHAAVRAGESLATESMRRIVTDLSQARSPMTCPHGRPTVWRLPLDQIEREFHRR